MCEALMLLMQDEVKIVVDKAVDKVVAEKNVELAAKDAELAKMHAENAELKKQLAMKV